MLYDRLLTSPTVIGEASHLLSECANVAKNVCATFQFDYLHFTIPSLCTRSVGSSGTGQVSSSSSFGWVAMSLTTSVILLVLLLIGRASPSKCSLLLTMTWLALIRESLPPSWCSAPNTLMLLGSSGSDVGSSSIIASTGGMGEAWDYNMYIIVW